MDQQIKDLETIFEKANLVFQNVSKCTTEGNGICAIAIYKSHEDYLRDVQYQITPRWTHKNQFRVTLCYGVGGWSNCVGILEDITLNDVFSFFELIKNTCGKLDED